MKCFLENLPTPTTPSEPATKEYVDGFDPLFAKYKKIAILEDFGTKVSFSDFDFRKVFSIIFKFNNYVVANRDNATAAVIGFGRSNLTSLVVEFNLFWSLAMTAGQRYTINSVFKYDAVGAKQNFLPSFILLLNTGSVTSPTYSFDTSGNFNINQVEIYSSGLYHISGKGNVEVWVRTIGD